MNSTSAWPTPRDAVCRRRCWGSCTQGLRGLRLWACPPTFGSPGASPHQPAISSLISSGTQHCKQAWLIGSSRWVPAQHVAWSHHHAGPSDPGVAVRQSGNSQASPEHQEGSLPDQQGSTSTAGATAAPSPTAPAALEQADVPFSISSCDSSDSDCSPDGNSKQHGSGSRPSHASLQGLFSLPQVPWGRGKIVQVMVLWLLAYIIIGQVAVPMALCLCGLDRDALGLRGHAVLHLCLDLSQLAVTLAILWGCLKKYKPRQRGLFPMSWRGWWPLVVLAACVVFPAVDWVAQQSLSWFPVEAAESWTNQMESSLSVGDWITNVAYFSVVSICAPIWEEAIFRGFLLTSLGRYMSPQWAVAVSSLLFAMCHFRLQTFLPLLILGVVFSFVFLLTRNLVPPMVLHSVWNVFVLANLLLRPG